VHVEDGERRQQLGRAVGVGQLIEEVLRQLGQPDLADAEPRRFSQEDRREAGGRENPTQTRSGAHPDSRRAFIVT